MTPRFTRFWARMLVIVGLVLVFGGALLAATALFVDMPWGSVTGQAVVERALVAAFLIASGVLAGAPFIVFGQMVLVFLDQRRVIGKIARRLARWERRLDTPATERRNRLGAP